MNRIVFALLIGLAFSFLVFLRLIPAIGNDVEFTYDSAFHYRMTLEVVKNGKVPEVDYLSTYPVGKEIRRFLPVGMYYIAAYFHKFINYFIHTPLERSILYFSSISGALIFIPIFLISHHIYKNKLIAFSSSILAGIIPAYLDRTLCFTYRYEVLAVPVLFMSLYFFMRAFCSLDYNKSIFYIFTSMMFMLIALSIWRLAAVFLLVYIICFLYILNKEKTFPKRFYTIIFITLFTFLLFFGLQSNFNDGKLAYNHVRVLESAFQIFLNSIGIKQSFSDFTRLFARTLELKSVTLPELFSSNFLSFMGIFIFVFPIFYLKNRTYNAAKDILFINLVFFFILTILFLRNKIFLGPLAAIVMGEGVIYALRYKNKLFRRLFLYVIIFVLFKTTYDAVLLVNTQHPFIRGRPYLAQMLNIIAKKIPQDSVILSNWSDGYPIQTYANRPTITDSLLESPEIGKRIIQLGKICYSSHESKLWQFCKKYGATHILISTNIKKAYAYYAGVSYSDYFRQANATQKGRRTILYKLIQTPKRLTRFNYLYSNREFTLYAVKK